jgi:hypothetical protein
MAPELAGLRGGRRRHRPRRGWAGVRVVAEHINGTDTLVFAVDILAAT